MTTPAEVLARPLTLRSGLVVPNRLLKSAMTEGMADGDNQPTERHERLYRRWADGGVGLLVTGNAMVHRLHLERARNVVLDAGVDPARLRAWARAVVDVPTLVQISHPGRQTNRLLTPRPVSASRTDRVALLGLFAPARALSLDEVQDVRDRFVASARRCVEAGFPGVQFHAAHGYLLSQFLSPRTNRRDDRYGGDVLGRARLLLEIVERTRRELGPEVTLSVKLNTNDFRRGGFAPEDAITVARALDEAGLDLLELSGGTYESVAFIAPDEATAAKAAYFIDSAMLIRQEVEVPLVVTGGWDDPAAMAAAVADGHVDMVGLARPLAIDPDLPRRLLAGHDARPTRPAPTMAPPLAEAADVGWYRRQMALLADGRSVDRDVTPEHAVLDYVGKDLAVGVLDGVRRRVRAARVARRG